MADQDKELHAVMALKTDQILNLMRWHQREWEAGRLQKGEAEMINSKKILLLLGIWGSLAKGVCKEEWQPTAFRIAIALNRMPTVQGKAARDNEARLRNRRIHSLIMKKRVFVHGCTEKPVSGEKAEACRRVCNDIDSLETVKSGYSRYIKDKTLKELDDLNADLSVFDYVNPFLSIAQTSG